MKVDKEKKTVKLSLRGAEVRVITHLAYLCLIACMYAYTRDSVDPRSGTHVPKPQENLNPDSLQVLEHLRTKEEESGRSDNRKEACAWHPEYGAWMVEGTPRLPFGGFVRDLRRVELSMRCVQGLGARV
jgi:hypothetical protein